MLFIQLLSLRDSWVLEIGSVIDLQYVPVHTSRLAFLLVLYSFVTNGQS